jgi:hypothetical protein
MHASSAPVAAVQQRPPAERRDWFAWYEDLLADERREIRGRLLAASYDEVKADADLRQYFFIHSEDIAGELPGTERLAELHAVLRHLRGSADAEAAEQRRKAVAFLLAEYQRYLRDNPWDV